MLKISENVSIIKEVLRKDTVMSILYAIISTIALSISIIFAKIGVKKANPSVVTALRTLIVSLGAWIILIFEKKTGLISTADGTDWLYIILTALAFCIALICYHISLKAGSITGVSSLMYVAPWLLIILNLFNKATASAFIPIVYLILIGLGIIFTISKSKKNGGKVLILGILAGIATTGTYIIKNSGLTINSMAVEWTLILTATLLISLIVVFIRGLQHGIGRISFAEIFIIILSGVAAFGAFYFFRLAYFDGNATATTAIVGINIASTATLSALFTKEKVSWKTICGILLIVTGTLLYEFLG